MSEKVLGLEIKDFNKAIKMLKEKEKDITENYVVSERNVVIGIRKILEAMIEEQVPVVSVEWLEKWCKKNSFVERFQKPKHSPVWKELISTEYLLETVRLQAKDVKP